MIDRWEKRADPRPGQEVLYWHILLGGNPAVRSIAAAGRERLTGFSGLHFTPMEWLHITTLPIGPAVELDPPEMEELVRLGAEYLAQYAPATVRLEKVLYHPEAIVIKVSPDGVLDEISSAIRRASHSVISRGEQVSRVQWTPHVTLAYSTSNQSARPIIDALGFDLPWCEIAVDRVDLVVQEGPERLWNWRSIAEVPIGQGSCRGNSEAI